VPGKARPEIVPEFLTPLDTLSTDPTPPAYPALSYRQPPAI